MMTGRGFGKTRAGAEWISALARADGGLRIALVGATLAEVERVMVCGESGLISVARRGEKVTWKRSRGLVEFASGAQAFAYSGASPDGLRGPEHHYAWCDELAKWAYPQETFDNLMLGLRLGAGARALVTTTPRPLALMRRLVGESDVLVTRGRTADNFSLPPNVVARLTERYGGTRFARQELDGELVEDAEGALVDARGDREMPGGKEGLSLRKRGTVPLPAHRDRRRSAGLGGRGRMRDHRLRPRRGRDRLCAGRRLGARAVARGLGPRGGPRAPRPGRPTG